MWQERQRSIEELQRYRDRPVPETSIPQACVVVTALRIFLFLLLACAQLACSYARQPIKTEDDNKVAVPASIQLGGIDAFLKRVERLHTAVSNDNNSAQGIDKADGQAQLAEDAVARNNATRQANEALKQIMDEYCIATHQSAKSSTKAKVSQRDTLGADNRPAGVLRGATDPSLSTDPTAPADASSSTGAVDREIGLPSRTSGRPPTTGVRGISPLTSFPSIGSGTDVDDAAARSTSRPMSSRTPPRTLTGIFFVNRNPGHSSRFCLWTRRYDLILRVCLCVCVDAHCPIVSAGASPKVDHNQSSDNSDFNATFTSAALTPLMNAAVTPMAGLDGPPAHNLGDMLERFKRQQVRVWVHALWDCHCGSKRTSRVPSCRSGARCSIRRTHYSGTVTEIVIFLFLRQKDRLVSAVVSIEYRGIVPGQDCSNKHHDGHRW